MWSSCFHSGSVTESAHSLGSTGSLPAPDTPMLSAQSLMSAQSSKSLPQVTPEPPASYDSGPGSESGCVDDMSGSGLDAVMSDSPRAGSSSKELFGSEHGEPDCQLIGNGWKLWAHKHVLKSESCVGVLAALACSRTDPAVLLSALNIKHWRLQAVAVCSMEMRNMRNLHAIPVMPALQHANKQ